MAKLCVVLAILCCQLMLIHGKAIKQEETKSLSEAAAEFIGEHIFKQLLSERIDESPEMTEDPGEESYSNPTTEASATTAAPIEEVKLLQILIKVLERVLEFLKSLESEELPVTTTPEVETTTTKVDDRLEKASSYVKSLVNGKTGVVSDVSRFLADGLQGFLQRVKKQVG